MKISFYLIVNSKGTVKTTKNRPGLNWDEISMKVNLELPAGLFQKPQLSADIKIPDEAATPTEITADVVENVRQAIEQASGMEVKLTIAQTES
jgi:hypothetical protein